MKREEFTKVLGQMVSLTALQRKKLTQQLEETQTEQEAANKEIPPAVAEADPEQCPHCGHDELGKWGNASGLQRWRCKDCKKTFNALTGTPLARLRKKEKWLDNADAMIAGETIERTAELCGVHPNTAFRWRHRFLDCQKRAQSQDLAGIAECDETYFYRSEKGSKNLQRRPRKRGGDKIKRGSKELVPVITLRDRSGHGADRVALDGVPPYIKDLFNQHLLEDTLLITDGKRSLCAGAKKRGKGSHVRVLGKEARGKKGEPYHTQTVNAFHSMLKGWMTRFRGVATKYLANYVGWHRHLTEGHHRNDPNLFIQLAFNPLAVNQQLKVI